MGVLRGSAEPLALRYRTALLDLDGVVYRGAVAVEHAVESLAQARRHALRTLFVTNNASRTPAEVATLISGFGLPVDPSDVVTSAQAAATLAAAHVPRGAPVLVVGGPAVETALSAVGLRTVRSAQDSPAAVVQGFAPDVDWRQLAEASYAVAKGLPWIVSNMDLAVPREGGIAPGNGALATAVHLATGRNPLVAGKPERAIFTESLTRGEGPHLVVGDGLHTDIEGATNSSLDSLLVLTGVTTVRALATAPVPHRPTYLAMDLRGLLVPHPSPEITTTHVRCGTWTAEVAGGALHLSTSDPTALSDGARALCLAAWSHPDASVEPALAVWAEMGERARAA
ncbi:HAD superfamily hydrolase (TIGR01450 family) [Crossiella equi]|uniref:HAD superfamily hydrolase (TIGR01450 family) n=1 Tax=Crossiella equi TaxID=130796 RepID=A0ABS5ALA8_9PSEU|nr:HAD-IIA family hydrolase [Crossiella equi]MBP2477348.1 HAD superfamily hydrolase (TIGR01450 family) [Crossiella equi]